MRLGIDIGRVIITPETSDRRDTSFIGGSLADALATPPVDGAFAAIAQLVRRSAGQAWLVSKARARVQEKTRQWLAHWRFFELTGVSADNLRFCLERPQKADHCRELRLTHFIDDRTDVLEHLDGIVAQRYLFGPQRPGTVVPAGVVACADWREVLARIA